MNYINNWITQITAPLPAGETVLQIPPTAASRLDLTNGSKYWLTLTNSANPLEQTQWEIVEVSAGLSLVRGRDGTAAQSWPADTLIYCALTAGQLTGILSAIEQLEGSVTSLEQRVDVLEQQGGGSRTITVEASPDNSADFYDYGFNKSMSFGAVSDENIDGRGVISWLYWGTYFEEGAWGRCMELRIQNDTDLDLVAEAKVTINSTVFTLDAYASGSDFVQLYCDITEEQFNSLPQSGDHAFQVELLP